MIQDPAARPALSANRSYCRLLCSALLCSVLFCSNVIMSAVSFSCPHVTQMRILRGQRAVNIRALAEGNLLLELPYRHAFMGGWSLRFEAHALGGAGTTVLYLSDPPIETDDKPRQPAFVMVRYQKRTFVVASAAGLDQCRTVSVDRRRGLLRRLDEKTPHSASSRVTIASHHQSAFCLSDVPVTCTA